MPKNATADVTKVAPYLTPEQVAAVVAYDDENSFIDWSETSWSQLRSDVAFISMELFGKTRTVKTYTDKFWFNENDGSILCGESKCHGNYLTSAISHNPRARRHVTPLGTWVRATKKEVAEMVSANWGACESCNARPGV